MQDLRYNVFVEIYAAPWKGKHEKGIKGTGLITTAFRLGNPDPYLPLH